MFLKHLKLENIRSLEALEIDFCDDDGKIRTWTTILGDNGIGKSTILRSIALVLAGSAALPALIGDPDTWIRNGKGTAVIEAVLANKEGEERVIALRFIRGQNIRSMFSENEKSLDLLDRALEHSKRNYFVVGYGVSRRISTSKDLNTTQVDRYSEYPRAARVATLFTSDANLYSIEQWAINLDYQTGGEGLKVVDAAMRDFLPEVRFLGIDKKNRQLMFGTPDGPVPLAFLSDGFQSAISWCGDLLYRVTDVFDDYRKPLNTRGLLLIDEIGLHMHFDWQRRLREYISSKFPNFQIVTTTHSPFAAHQAGEGELYSLNREPGVPRVTLEKFEGVPNRLLLHQLIMTPFFGLNTMSSLKWEELRNEYRQLAAKKRLARSDRDRMEELEDLLEDQPDWSAGREYYSEIKAVMEDLLDEKESGK